MKWSISAQELADGRRALGYTTEHLGALLGVPAERVADWEAGNARVPFRHVRLLEWWLAVAAREKAVAADTDLPECEWASKFERRRKRRGQEEDERSDEEWDAHLESCSVCKKRDALVDEQYTVPTYPEPLWVVILGIPMGEWLPEWASLSVPSAIVFGVVRFLRGDPRFTKTPGSLGIILDIALATLVGAALGLAWGAARYVLGKKKTRAA